MYHFLVISLVEVSNLCIDVCSGCASFVESTSIDAHFTCRRFVTQNWSPPDKVDVVAVNLVSQEDEVCFSCHARTQTLPDESCLTLG